MGWTVLYIAFGLVALWLLGEVLLQYKARLRWRLLAFGGFLGVVVGVLLASVPVIIVGTLAFATGQTFVTLSFRRGFSTGWAIGGSPGESRRRKRGGEGAAVKEPTLQVSDLEVAEPDAPAGYDRPPAAPPAPSVYATEPLPDDTGQYGVYGDTGHDTNGHAHQDQGHDADPSAQPQYAAYDPYTGYGQQQAQDPYAGTYDYGTGEQSYAAYSDPYIGTTNQAPSYGYDAYGYDSQGGQQSYAAPYAQGYGQDTYGTEAYATDTPPGGVWVPQQRDAEQYPPMPPEQPTAYGNGYDTGQNEQYRY
ncbi:hypothetical protein ACWD45_32060 [Streptomyces rubiginosohelvolus]